MKRPKRDPVREDRIHNEAIADANGPEEQVMGWHCYLDDKIRFPFQAKCMAVKVVSPLRKGETVEVLRMAPEDACSADMLVVIHWQDRTMAVPLSQLAAVDPDDSTAEAEEASRHLGRLSPGGTQPAPSCRPTRPERTCGTERSSSMSTATRGLQNSRRWQSSFESR